jgi:hypothetical protein
MAAMEMAAAVVVVVVVVGSEEGMESDLFRVFRGCACVQVYV